MKVAKIAFESWKIRNDRFATRIQNPQRNSEQPTKETANPTIRKKHNWPQQEKDSAIAGSLLAQANRRGTRAVEKPEIQMKRNSNS